MKSNSGITTELIEGRTPFRLPGAFQFEMLSKRGESYRIFVYEPPAASPALGFPVLYLLDGNATFATAVDTLALQMRRTEATGVPPSVIVGIGYPTDAPLDVERRLFDYTPAGAVIEAGSGGSAHFSAFIEAELKPAIEGMIPVDRQRQAVFGHSFGGLFTLWSLFTRPGTFQSYIAASPSIWWGDYSILSYEAAFIRQMRDNIARPRLLVTVGNLEQSPQMLASGKFDTSMAEDAAALAARLRSQAGDRVDVTFAELADETHVSVIPAAISRSVRFAWCNS
jgi:predicted alpha/beta superfamily hydrolase